MTPKRIAAFQKTILDWFAVHQRDLPWRQSRDPYRILVSEIMLQQTQVSRVIPKFEAWLETFPTIATLAKAPTADVLRLWSGLGYNRRALYLQKAAQVIMEKHAGKFPKTFDELRSLPGLGDYTAGAVLCFGFNQQVAVVDTNIRKVIALEFFDGVPPKPKELQQVADKLLPRGKAYQWNQALMDYAAAVLKNQKVPVAKQSNFKNSDRYFRGQIIKQLLDKTVIKKPEVGPALGIDDTKATKIIDGLLKDGLVVEDKAQLRLP